MDPYILLKKLARNTSNIQKTKQVIFTNKTEQFLKYLIYKKEGIMKKKIFTMPANLKIFLLLMLIIPWGIAFPLASSAQAPDNSGITPYVAVEVMPTYPGGSPALSKFISERLRYPSGPEEKGIQGKVIVKFCVSAEGGVSMFSVTKSVDPELDQEAVRVVKMITKFNPGKKDGIAVPVWFLIPITFSLK